MLVCLPASSREWRFAALMKAVQGRSKSTEGKSQRMSLRRQIVMQISNSTHTSSLHKSRIIFVFKYFLPQLQSAWGGWERVICKHKNSYDFKSSLLETNGTYTPQEQTSNQRCLCSFGKWTKKTSCSRTGQKGIYFFNPKGPKRCCSEPPPTPPYLTSAKAGSGLLLTFITVLLQQHPQHLRYCMAHSILQMGDSLRKIPSWKSHFIACVMLTK